MGTRGTGRTGRRGPDAGPSCLAVCVLSIDDGDDAVIYELLGMKYIIFLNVCFDYKF